jgi:putative sigma-54 modulation protein
MEVQMQVSVTFRHMDASESLKGHAIEKSMRIKKYFDQPAEAHIVLSMERYLKKAEINMWAHGMVMCGKVTSEDMYNAIDRAIGKIEKQVKRYRGRLLKTRPKYSSKLKMRFNLFKTDVDLHQEESEISSHIIETKEFQARPMMLDEAVMQMDLLNNDVLVFLNVKTDQINVLYRKKDNKYGLIETISNG